MPGGSDTDGGSSDSSGSGGSSSSGSGGSGSSGGSSSSTGGSSSGSGSSGSSGGSSGAGSGSSSGASSSGVSDAGTGAFAGAPPYTQGSGGSGHHNAGRACFSCHGGIARAFSFAGTVYDASGSPAVGVEVRMVDAHGTAVSIYSGTNGNFYEKGSAFASPAHVGARNTSATKDMLQTIVSGDCNSCHCTASTCVTVPIHVP